MSGSSTRSGFGLWDNGKELNCSGKICLNCGRLTVIDISTKKPYIKDGMEG